MKVDVETKKEVKNELHDTFILGELEPSQYFVYKGGEQQYKDKNTSRTNDILLQIY